MQCVRSSQEAAGEIHALGAGAEAWRPEPGEQAGAGIKAPSPTSMELRMGRIELSLGILLFGSLLPPEALGKEGKCQICWAWTASKRDGPL